MVIGNHEIIISLAIKKQVQQEPEIKQIIIDILQNLRNGTIEAEKKKGFLILADNNGNKLIIEEKQHTGFKTLILNNFVKGGK